MVTGITSNPFFTATEAVSHFAKLFKYIGDTIPTHCKNCGEELLLTKVEDWGYAEYNTNLIYCCPKYRWWRKNHTTTNFNVPLLAPAKAYKEIARGHRR